MIVYLCKSNKFRAPAMLGLVQQTNIHLRETLLLAMESIANF